MSRFLGTRFQVVLLLLLFLGSLLVLLFSTWTTLALPFRELEARKQLQSASRQMAEMATPLADSLLGKLDPNRDDLNEKLRLITANALKDYPGLEGGFFLALDDRFIGYAYPTSNHAPSDFVRNEPPPLETPFIRKQAQECLDGGESALRTEEVQSSRVVFITEPVGQGWPASLTTWVMVRLTGPEQLHKQLRQAELSSFLALGGVLLSLVLTWNLGRTLKRQRREQEVLREQLQQTEHLASLGKLLAGVAHEVRNPLAAIRSTVQLWQRFPHLAPTPDSQGSVVRGVDRLNAIVSKLLLFSRMDNAERQPVDLNQLLEETLALVKAQAEDQGIHMKRQLWPDLPPVSGSASALGQVILNLISNAMQAMPQGGFLTLTTNYRPVRQQVEVIIADTGSGVTEEVREHLFEPFFTTRPDGTGLGLALCREIVTNHKGTIEYVTGEGSGAAFQIVLPIAQGP